MVKHTLVFSFPEAMSGSDRDQFFSEAATAILGSGLVESFNHKPHLPLPGDARSPFFISSAMAEIRCVDLSTLQKLFEYSPLHEFVQRWQAIFPYKMVWVNTEAECCR